VISGVQSVTDDTEWMYDADDEFSGSLDDSDMTTVSVEFHCYHSLPSALWSDEVSEWHFCN